MQDYYVKLPQPQGRGPGRRDTRGSLFSSSSSHEISLHVSLMLLCTDSGHYENLGLVEPVSPG
jgi:hypothetical protein